MPGPSTIWLKIGNIDVRMTKKLTSNALVAENKPPPLADFVNDKPVRSVRSVTQCHYEQIGTGEQLTAEVVLKNSKGEEVSTAAARFILDKYSNLVLDEVGQSVDKKAIKTYFMTAEGARGDLALETPPTDVIQEVATAEDAIEPGMAVRVPSSAMEDFLISEQYEIVAAELRNDPKVYAEAEKLSKADEVLMFAYSNGGFNKMYYGFLRPFFSEGQFEFELLLSDKKVVRNLLRDVPAPTNAIKAKPVFTLPAMGKMLQVPAIKK